MKKILITILSIICIFSFSINKVYARDDKEIFLYSKSAILIDYDTGTILYEKNINEKLYPASMTKVMAMYLILENITNTNKSFNDIVRVSEFASSMGGSQVFLKENEEMTIEDLFKAVCLASANDAIVALAEHTYGDISSFVKLMNDKAKELNMNNTNYVNVTGFHDDNHFTSALDMAIISRTLLKKYKDIVLKYTSLYDDYLRKDSSSPFWLVNTNKMVKTYNGMDGLKTGYTKTSGFNLVATAKRDNLRLISVVMNSSSSKERSFDTKSLLDYGFNNYKLLTLYKKGDVISTHTFNNSKEINSSIISKENISYIVKKDEDINKLNISIDITKDNAPININDKIGKITISGPNNTISYDIYVKENINKLTFIDIFLNYFKLLLS